MAEILKKVASGLPERNWTCRDTVTSAPVSPVWSSALLFTWWLECVTSISIVMEAVSPSRNVFKVNQNGNSFLQKRNISSPVDCNGEQSGAATSCAARTGKILLPFNKWTSMRKWWPCLPARCAGIVPLAPAYEAFAAACARARDADALPCVKRAQLPEYTRYATFWCKPKRCATKCVE